jgi:putative flippase GtrA
MPKPPYIKAWVIFFLIATVGGAILGAIIGAFLGIALTIARVDLGTIKVVAAVIGFLIGIPLSFVTFKWVVSEYIVKPLVQVPPVVEASREPPPLSTS